jgi:type I restriction enzyme M protein
VLDKAKRPERRGKVILINASAEFEKGWPKNFLPEAAVARIADRFHAGVEVERFVKVVSTEEVAANDFNLSSSRYVTIGTVTEYRPIQEILHELAARLPPR